MSRSHAFYMDFEVKEFSSRLLDLVQTIVDKNRELVSEYKIDREHVLVAFPTTRPAHFHITTRKEDAIFTILDKALFSFSNYYPGRHNLLLCQLALVVKYQLKEKFCITSDDWSNGFVGGDWRQAQEIVNQMGLDIKMIEEEDEIACYIDNQKVENEFDKDKSIFNQLFRITPISSED
ncbi:hypothetical protein PP175_28275 (plasmid) [Aneurinibacillus sp. Ricciae_BoGa-3]|uniref:hypothetical protein n=1 Tax=Aneurinibacillus sp. Ricciae_BoGa-3 TaxID=3022697 RepID=UPI0023401DBC|nr:hypothetical protein [Aneurinibacillus sp. Ricciae_BoGa-3]WCK57088.1 hypothetical protein PP175_28275 [Aneurinibacillus sp. Ricciae_BoGa-3]